jgi:hypothetical protein
VNKRRNTRTCFKCGEAGHYFAECPKFMDKRKKSKKKDHEHGKKAWSREKMKRSSDTESDSEDTSSSSSDEDEEDDKKKKKRNLVKFLNGLCDGPKPQGRLLWHGSQFEQQEKPEGRLRLGFRG